MDAAALDVAAAASTSCASPSLHLRPWGERGREVEGEGLEALTGRGVASDNKGKPSLSCSSTPASPPLRLSSPPFLIGCSGFTSEREGAQMMEDEGRRKKGGGTDDQQMHQSACCVCSL